MDSAEGRRRRASAFRTLEPTRVTVPGRERLRQLRASAACAPARAGCAPPLPASRMSCFFILL